ncbi:sensor histidine kinase [Cognataquiflexum rubidum]|uniref:sensor histidine kinase n=1 Tax=Cognataquiflexum rubidum TaxID=2922273 RepID=UPI001F142F1C|nr:ATP-binding protein [Cognataquiflexum rubidum]MCH6235917.1 ATP-binding protein [Cognataquiflexum rubidum]
MQKALLLIFFVWFGHTAFAQTFQFNNQIKGVDLPSDIIHQVLQDKEGLMWFNTSLGVFYSDGFDTYPLPEDIQSDLTNEVRIFKDEDSRIWISNLINEPKAYFYQDGIWEEFDLKTNLPIDGNQDLLLFLPKKTPEGWQYLLFSDSKLFFRNENESSWQMQEFDFRNAGPFKSDLGTPDGILVLFRYQTYIFRDGHLQEYAFKGIDLPAKVQHIAFDEVTKGYYFLGLDFLAYGKSYESPEKILRQNFEREIFSVVDFSHLQVFEGRVYYNYNSQLYKYDPKLNRSLEIDSYDVLKAYFIHGFLVDREGIKWIATNRGLANINSFRFINYSSKSLLDDEVTAIIGLDSSRYLIGFNNGLQIWSRNSDVKTLYGYEGLVGHPKFRISNFDKDKNGIIWFSSNLKGIGRLDPKTSKVDFQPSPQQRFVTSVRVIGDSLFIAARGSLYLSSIANKGSHFLNEITDNILKIFGQDQIFVRKTGKLRDGRIIFMQGSNPNFTDGIVEKQSFVTAVGFDYIEEENGCLILGTESGLKYFCEGKFDYFQTAGGNIDRPVYSLLKDSKGYLWVGTDKGLYKIKDGRADHYTEVSGLSGLETNRGALLESDNGRIWIGTSKGLSVFIPEENIERVYSPITKILSVKVLGSESEGVDLMRIPFGVNNIEITYRAVSFIQPNDLVIKYKLEGLQDEWTEIVNPRTNVLTFNNLPAGNYRLLLKAGVDGVFNTPEVASEGFKILKPVYLQPWFVISVLFVFLLIGFLFNTLLNLLRKEGLLKKTIDEKIKQVFNTEDQFRNVWNSSKDGLLLSTDAGKIIAANPSLAKLVSLPVKEIEKGFVTNLFTDPEFYPRKREVILPAITNEENKGMTFELSMPLRGGMKEIELYVAMLKSDHAGNPLILSVFRDVTAEKAFEKGLQEAKDKAEEANKLKSNFLSNISHEIRTPLNGILGSTENIILQRQEDANLISQLEIIQESGERLLSTINSILDLSKIEAKKLEVVYKESNINDFLATILLPLKGLAVKKGLLLSVKYETQPLKGWIDQRYFEMIVNNLVGNAIKYSDKGIISITLNGLGDKITLTVTDQGIGMSQDFQQILFKPFEQESKGNSRIYEGTGLGLAITKNLVDILGGSIRVESQKEEGTKVIVILPLGKK